MPDKLILASGSPQRKRILKKLGVKFLAVKSRISESHGALKNPKAIAKHLALKKADAVSQFYPNAWILGVDTLVVLNNGKISGKPKNRNEAKAILRTYSGSHCDVISGIALLNRTLKKKLIASEKARLYFRRFSENEIDQYLARDLRWRGSSGAMTIEGVGGLWVKRLKGDYWNVVGLPVITLKKLLTVSCFPIGFAMLRYPRFQNN